MNSGQLGDISKHLSSSGTGQVRSLVVSSSSVLLWEGGQTILIVVIFRPIGLSCRAQRARFDGSAELDGLLWR